ncbi:MAG: hypothetical protein J6B39_07945 [Lachnospiraceae bacterium]|nr:hypothetical protein [Lachnospiraceae bacterium]
MTRDVSTIKKDRLRYTKNKLSSNLAYLGILFDVLYFVSIYGSDVGNYYYTITIGLSVVYNLIFLLAAFLSSEGVKNYKLGYSYFIIVVGVLQFARIFGIPSMAHSALTVVNGVETMVMGDKQFIYVIICLVLSGAACIVSGIAGAYKTIVLEKYKKDNGIA